MHNLLISLYNTGSYPEISVMCTSEHDSKQKCDIAESAVETDLIKERFNVSCPKAEHLRYDLIAERQGLAFRVQIKYTKVRNNSLNVKLSSSYRTASAIKVIPRMIGDYDILAAYCPDTDRCYYLADNEFDTSNSVNLYLGGQNSNRDMNRFAAKYESPLRAFNIWRSHVQISNEMELPNREDILILKKDKTWNEIGDRYGVSGENIRLLARTMGIDVDDPVLHVKRFSPLAQTALSLRAHMDVNDVAIHMGLELGNVQYLLLHSKMSTSPNVLDR